MALKKHGVDDVREVEALLMLKAFVITAEGGGIREGVASGGEVVGDDTFLDDVGDIVHVIDRNITLILGVDPIELLQRMDGDGIVCSIFARKAAVGILNEDGALDMPMEDRPVDSLRLGASRFIQNNYLGIGNAIDAKLEEEALGKGILLIQVAQDCDIDTVKLREVKTFESTNAMHNTILSNKENTRNTRLVFGFVCCYRHDEGAG